ncbi:putative U-box domain-containing protein 13-like isoform X1 [Sesbania bispinosa]|nr:putative U-box domain-containing protein 13-like isoform X1 [Sesbania bispinosa]
MESILILKRVRNKGKTMRVGILPILMQLPMGLGGGMVDEAVTILAIFNYSCPLFWRSTMSTSGSGVGGDGSIVGISSKWHRQRERKATQLFKL